MNDIVSFETAVLLKELGFDQSTNFYYEHNSKLKKLIYYDPECINNNNNNWLFNFNCTAPYQSKVQKWLREEHGIFVNVDVNIFGKWIYLVFNLNAKRCSEIPEIYETSKNFISSNYEKTMENGIKNALIYLKSKKNAGTTN